MPLWAPDEEILAANLNLRERKYGGIYFQDFIGSNTPTPVISFVTTGYLYGSPVYGFSIYKAVAGAGLIEDTLATSTPVPTITTALDHALYNEPLPYGFFAYGLQASNIMNESITAATAVPTFVTNSGTYLYGVSGGDYGFMQYGVASPVISTLTTGENTITLTLSLIAAFAYDTGRKYGFCVYS